VQPAPFKAMELFNLRDDPAEKNTLPVTHPEFVRLQQELQHHLVRVIGRSRPEAQQETETK
jgi:hypothetical protein